ncbi:MAG: ABC-F family ATP-binding cassette domain-containing protein [Candidatus Pacebacteria bacterium]|nr:ABC-F family ATP-binding cassette domain-containing protein [Candidatus Paceibacterota bacterium]
MAGIETVVRFEKVSYEYNAKKRILDEANFSIKRGAKLTLMGQNGAGKSTIFGLITGSIEPESGNINLPHGLTIAVSRQVIPRAELDLTVRDFFQAVFPNKVYDIDPKIDEVLEIVNLHAPHDRIVRSFSGGQQARLLLASALIQQPDVLLLDEPTNNLDKAGIAHLIKFLQGYEKTLVVISHDAEFLNSFTQGVLYLDVHTQKTEQYVGNYNDVLEDIRARIEKENMKNAQLAKKIQANKDQANVFAHKGGGMRLVAKRMRQAAEDAEEEMVDIRKEDKTIKAFKIPTPENMVGEILKIESYKVILDHKAKVKKKTVILKKNQHLLLEGPNGIGKSTLLEAIVNQEEGSTILPGTKVGYYRQDFSNLDFEKTVHEELMSAMKKKYEETLRAVAAGFLLTGDIIHTKIGHLSEGQKGLVAFARLVLMEPALLILDEPTNHINFRHIPAIAKALDS